MFDNRTSVSKSKSSVSVRLSGPPPVLLETEADEPCCAMVDPFDVVCPPVANDEAEELEDGENGFTPPDSK